MSEEALFFGDVQNEYRCLSLEYPCSIDYDEHIFGSVIDLYLYLKFSHKETLKDKLLNIKSHQELLDFQEIIERGEDNKEDTDLSDDMINMSLAVQYRVEQHELVKRLLLETKKRNLLYVVSHSILEPYLWAYKVMGESMESDGQNLYGNILKMTRVRLIMNIRKINMDLSD